MEVKDIQGNILIDALVTEQAIKVDELMKQHSITLSWVSVTDDELPLGAYIEHEGVRYSLLAPYKPEQSDEATYAYKPVFEHPIMRWQYIPFFFYTYSEGKVVSKELDWNLTDNPANFMKAVCDAILNETGEDWSYEISADLSASASQSFSNTDIFSALNAIAGAFETEWWFDYANKIVYLSKASFGSAVTLEVGQNIGVPSKNQSKDGYYTRFYAFGSTRNIEQNYAGSNVNSIVNKRLTLNPAKYPNGYIDIREGLTESEILVKTLVFDDIYPRSSLTIEDVKVRLMWRLDSDKKKVQIGTDSNGNPVYDQYAIWYFKVPGLQFDKDSIISGKPLSVHFNSGALNGREFELTYHDTEEDVETSDGTSIHVEKGDFEINFIEEGTFIIPAISGLVPNDGDEITLFNIKMPEEYKASAYNDLEEAVLKEIAKQDVDNNNYTFESNKEAFFESNPNLTVGRKVLYKNGNSVLETRVIKLETQLDYAFEQKITIGNEQIKGNTQTLKEEVVNANQNIDLISAINESTQQLVQSYQRTQKALLDSMAKWGDMWQLDKQNNAVRTPLNLIVEGTIGMGNLNSGPGGDVPSSNVVIKFEGEDDVYAPVNGVITLPAYPEGGGGGTAGLGSVTVRVNGKDYITDASGIVTIPDYPTSLPASDVYSWAKAATKPTYTASEVGALSTSGGTIENSSFGNHLSLIRPNSSKAVGIHFGNSIDGNLGYIGVGGSGNDFGIVPFYRDTSDAYHILIHSGNIGSQSVDYANSAGTVVSSGYVTDANAVSYTDKALRWFGAVLSTASNIPTYTGYQNGLLALPLHSNGITAQLYLSYSKKPYYRSSQFSDWNEIAYVTDNVASATKLHDNTAFTAWGQTFFENGKPKNIDGANIRLIEGTIFWHDDIANYYIKSPVGSVGGYFEYKAYSGHRFLGGNVLIGSTTDNGAKLQVNGNITATSVKIGSATLSWDEANKALKINTNIYSDGTIAMGELGEGGSGTGGATGIVTIRVNGADYTSSNGIVTLPNYPTVPTALKSPYALTFGSKTYDGSAAKTILASDLGALTAHQDISHLLSKTNAANTYQTKITSTNKIPYSNVSGTPVLASVATSGKYSDLSGVPTSLPASDVYSWAKAVTKPSYTASEVGALSVNGGTMSGDIVLPDGKLIRQNATNGSALIGVVSNEVLVGTTDNPLKLRSNGTSTLNGNTLIHSGNIGSYNAGSATKLQTSRKIWGQYFDGSASVDGDFTMQKDVYGGTGNLVAYNLNFWGAVADRGGIIRCNINDKLGHFDSFEFLDRSDVLMTIKNNGNILMGTTEDNGAKLQVKGQLSMDWDNKIFWHGDRGNYYIACPIGDYGGVLEYKAYSGHRFLGGNVLIGSTTDNGAKLQVNGNITAEGTIAMARLASSSDRKLKDNIAEVSAEQSMGIIRQLRPTTWDWKKDGKKSYGLIAQEVAPIVPEMVVDMGHLHLEYNQLHAFEIGAIQHLDIKVETQEQNIERLENRVNELESELRQYRRA